MAWMYHRMCKPDATPRKLVWCMPMRVLVDQASTEARRWVDRLSTSGIDSDHLPRSRDVYVLMGGEGSGAWLENPERPAIIVGTQDMLLSRSLMRGYASSRSVWPMEFGLLHQDTQWVFDEVQLMAAGRATSAQLEAFRHAEVLRVTREGLPAGRPCRSLWISATLEPEWLETVDHKVPTNVLRVDPAKEEDDRLLSLVRAPKHLQRTDGPAGSSLKAKKAYIVRLADSVVDAHRSGHMTLVIVNQVERAQDLYRMIHKVLAVREDEPTPDIVLLHSRFRPTDRERELDRVMAPDTSPDVIVIATQAVEAGIDISAAVMFTELAPWASMVQRFGRSNRRAEVAGGAQVYWIDLLGSDAMGSPNSWSKLSLPYESGDLRNARSKLVGLTDVAPCHLPRPDGVEPPLRVLRRKDLDDLFDTEADLTGFDVDISPYIRDANDTDVRVFWRELPISEDGIPKPNACELCAVPIGLAKKWAKNARNASGSHILFVRDPQFRRRARRTNGGEFCPPGWTPLREPLRPGMTILAGAKAGGYDEKFGFTGARRHVPKEIAKPLAARGLDEESEGFDDDSRSETGRPIGLASHLRHVAEEASRLCAAVGLDDRTSRIIIRAGRWHDLGKAHAVFQETMRRGLAEQAVPADVLLAKTAGRNLRHGRPYFRHELASALAFLDHENWNSDADLCAFLIAAHHGKVRMNLRALPRESAPKDPERVAGRFARGVWEGDALPHLDLGDGEHWPGGKLTLSVMELGWDEATKESWTERTRELLFRHGPFRLAWLEALLRIADWRASRKETMGGYE